MTSPPQSLTVVSPYGGAAPSTRVRVYEWLDHLGIEAERLEYAGLGRNGLGTLLRRPLVPVRAELRTRAAVKHVHDATVLVSREASPFSRGGIESRMLRSAARGVYDLDDALFADNRGWRRVLAKDVKCRRAIQEADQVIVGNDYLADYASAYTRDLAVIPTCVDPSMYEPKASYEIDGPPTLVWLGSPSTEQYLESIAPALHEVHRRSSATLVLVSGPKPRDHVELGPFVRRVPWAPDTVAQVLASADVALGPLRDDEYARGKCAYKLLQYAATGLPMVASPVGANASAISRFEGLPATSDDDWIDAITALLDTSVSERAARGATALLGVRTHYAFNAWADDWKRAVGI